MKPTGVLLLPSLVAAVLVSVCPALAAAQSAAGEPPGPAVTTTGEGIVKRAPDRAFVDISVESRAKTPRDAQAQNAEIMTAVQQKLRAVNLPKDAVRTIGYGVDAEFDFANGRRVLRGYLARNAIEVRVDDLTRVGEVVDLAVSSGATSVGDVRFDLKDRHAAEREAFAAAVADARGKADAIIAAAGRTAGPIWRIVEEPSPMPIPRPMLGRAMSVNASAVPTPVTAGDIEVQARITFTVLLTGK